LLRCDTIDFWEQVAKVGGSATEQHLENARNLIQKAQLIDQRLTSWAANLPKEWGFATQSQPEPMAWSQYFQRYEVFFNETCHEYSSLEHAATWNRYRAARLICNSVVLKAYTSLPIDSVPTSGEHTTDFQVAETNTHSLVDDICASVPFHYSRDKAKNPSQGVGGLRNMTEPETETTTARTAFLLVWPLLISSSAWGVPDRQKKWLKEQLLRVGQITTSGVLQSLATK
jgi:hypothetical protein